MQQDSVKILLVDDDLLAHELIGHYLKKEGFTFYSATTSTEALALADTIKPNVILLDLILPGIDGVELCEELRKKEDFKNAIIIIVTARIEDYGQIAGFEAGADDYITKPIKNKILISRINALLKRKLVSENNYILPIKENLNGYSSLVIDNERYLVIINGEEVTLPKKEFELLSYLKSDPKKIFTRTDIFSTVWPGKHYKLGKRTIDVHIRKLRKRIGEKYIKTVKGIGYKYVD